MKNRVLIILTLLFLPYYDLCGRNIDVINDVYCFPLCGSRQIKKLDNSVCENIIINGYFSNVRKIYLERFFIVYREYTGTGDFFERQYVSPTGNFCAELSQNGEAAKAYCVIMDNSHHFLGLYTVSGGILTDIENCSDTTFYNLILFAMSQKETLSIKYFFVLDNKWIMGIDNDSQIYVFWRDKENFTATAISNFSEQKLLDGLRYKDSGLIDDLLTFFKDK